MVFIELVKLGLNDLACRIRQDYQNFTFFYKSTRPTGFKVGSFCLNLENVDGEETNNFNNYVRNRIKYTFDLTGQRYKNKSILPQNKTNLNSSS